MLVGNGRQLNFPRDSLRGGVWASHVATSTIENGRLGLAKVEK